jgi:hypothetical protein
MADVYINCISSFFPNEVVQNDEMEEYLGILVERNQNQSELSLEVTVLSRDTMQWIRMAG